jgi:hypothetical protein
VYQSKLHKKIPLRNRGRIVLNAHGPDLAPQDTVILKLAQDVDNIIGKWRSGKDARLKPRVSLRKHSRLEILQIMPGPTVLSIIVDPLAECRPLWEIAHNDTHLIRFEETQCRKFVSISAQVVKRRNGNSS